MSRTLRSPMVRGSTVLLGLGVLLWLLFRPPISAPHHGIQAYAPFQILARHLQEPSGLSPDRRPSLMALIESAERGLVTILTNAPRAMVTDVSPVRAGKEGFQSPRVYTANVRFEREESEGNHLIGRDDHV